MPGPTSGASTTKWLWLLVFLIGWPVAFQVTSFVAAIVATVGVPRVGELALAAVALTAAAWSLARFAFSRGAPSTIWVSVAIGSLPYALIALVALFGARDVLDFFGVAAAVVLPPAAVYLESRRPRTAVLGPAITGTQGAEQAFPADSAQR